MKIFRQFIAVCLIALAGAAPSSAFWHGNSSSGPPPLVPHFFQGTNLSGLEDIPPSQPPSVAEIGYFVSNGMTNFRLPINWNNIQPTINTALDPTNVATLHQALANFAAAGGVATIDLHMFGSCPGPFDQAQVGSTACPISAYVNLWTQIVAEFGSDPGLYGIDLMNEWQNGFPFSILFDAQQQAITAIRDAGYTGFIYAEGTNYTGAWNWVTGQGNPYNNATLWQLFDPLNKLKIEGHMYYDRDNSGTHYSYIIESTTPGLAPPGVMTNPTIGNTRLAPWVAWGATNNQVLNYGEGGTGSDAYGLGGTLDFADWNVMLDNAIAIAKANNIEYWYWGNGPGLNAGFLGATWGYGYNSEPFSSIDLITKDFSTAGVQSPQMAVLRRAAGSTAPQPIAYALARPLSVTSSGNPQAPVIAPILYTTQGTPTAPFQVYYGGEIASAVTITPHDTLPNGTAAGGTFTPTSLTLAAGENALASFTYTPSQQATIEISTTNNVGWIDPPAVGISSCTDNYTALPPTALTPIYGMYNRFTPNIYPALRLQRSTDSAQQDFYFTEPPTSGCYLGLDRVAIQTWASARSGITVLRHYDQSPKHNNLNFNQASQFIASIAGTTMTIPAGSAPGLAIGQVIVDDIFKVAPGTTVVSGSGGSWTVSISQNVQSENMFSIATSGVTLATLNLNDSGYPDIVDPSNNSAIMKATFTGPFTGASQLSVISRFNQSSTAGVTGGLFRTDHFLGPAIWGPTAVSLARTGWVGGPPNLTNAANLATVTLNITQGSYGDYAWTYNTNSSTGHKTYKNGSITATASSILSSFTASGAGTNLTVASVGSGSIQPSDTIYGDPCVPAGTYIVSQTSGTTGGAGVYTTSAATTCASASLTTSYVMYPAFNDGTTTFGWFNFAAIFWNGTYTNLEFITQALTDAQTEAIMATDATYYSTPLPDTLPAVPPTIAVAGSANQAIYPALYTSYPFSNVIITDTNSGTPTDSVTITLAGSGTLSGTGISGSGPYTIASASAASVTATLQAAAFTTSNSIGATTTFTIAVVSSAGSSASNSNTSTVVTTYVAETPFAAPGGTFTPIGNYSGYNLDGGENLAGAPTGFLPPTWKVDYAASKGFGIIRLPTTSALLYPYTTQFQLLNSACANAIQTVIAEAYMNGQYVLIDPHDFGSMYAFQTGHQLAILPNTLAENLYIDMMSRIATKWKNWPNVIFGTNNEPGQTGQTGSGWQSSVLKAITAVRATGATQKFSIMGFGWHTNNWVSSGNAALWALPATTIDPLANFWFEFHQYLDSNNEGNTPVAVTGAGAVALTGGGNTTAWLATNSFQGFIGEFGIGWPNPWYPLLTLNPSSPENYDATQSSPQTTNSVIENSVMLAYAQAHPAQWVGWTAFAAGAITAPKYNGGYFFQVEPMVNSSNTAYQIPITDQPQLSTLQGLIINFLLKKDIDPSSNDNDPMWLEKAA